MMQQTNGARQLTGDLNNYLTIGEVAELYGVTRTAVSYWLSAGHLPTYLDGKKKLIWVEDLENFERPAKKKPGRPKGSRNKVTRLQPVQRDASAKRRLELEHGGRADEVSQVLFTLGTALTKVSALVEKLNTEAPETSRGELLRADLRSSHRLLRRTYDFLLDAENTTLRAESKVQELTRDLARELRGS